VVISNEVCSTSTAMSSRTLLSGHIYWFCIVRQSEEVFYAECPERYCPQQSTRGLASSALIENVASAMLPMHSQSDSSPRKGQKHGKLFSMYAILWTKKGQCTSA